jgi:hypothetical protein
VSLHVCISMSLVPRHSGRAFGKSHDVKSPLPWIGFVCGLLVSLWLLRDGMVFGLCKADPATGRARGCYTDIELLFAFKTPSSWARPVELGVGAAMFLGSLIVGVNIFTSRSQQ